jgi:hypothetical protein
MPRYALTYSFDSDGGNIEHQTTRRVENEASSADIEVTLVTTGLSLGEDRIDGIAIVDTPEEIAPAAVFDSAHEARSLATSDEAWPMIKQASREPTAARQPAEAIERFEVSEEISRLLARVSDTPGRGVLFDAHLTRWQPHEHDTWLVTVHSKTIDADSGLSIDDVVSFYRDHLDRGTDEHTLLIGCYRETDTSTVQLSLVAAVADPQSAQELAGQAGSRGVMNASRFELAKASLVVGESTHGPGQVDAVFRNQAGDEVCSGDLVYRRWHEDCDVYFHPLGVIVDGDLYRPAAVEGTEETATDVGNPIFVETYRGSTGKPWQFGITRIGEQLLLTQARAGPAKFDPVLKQFPIERQVIGAEPLVFSHTVSRRLWTEDPVNPQIQSQRSEGLVTQFLYREDGDWHLIQPKAGNPSDDESASFEPTPLNGVSVRSSLLRAEMDGETKATVEHEYRVTDAVLNACDCVYVLSYYEANEESVDRLQWDIADATAYEILPAENRTASHD